MDAECDADTAELTDRSRTGGAETEAADGLPLCLKRARSLIHHENLAEDHPLGQIGLDLGTGAPGVAVAARSEDFELVTYMR